MRNKVVKVGDSDREMWERITNVPKVSKTCAVISAIFNCLLPGSGTTIAACFTEEDTVSKIQILIAAFQFMTAFFLVGWIFSIYWAYLIVVKAFNLNNKEKLE